MPLFFFDTSNGDRFILDDTGVELPDLEAAKAEAEKVLPEIAKEKLPDGDRRDFIVSVRDESGETVLRVTLSLFVEYTSKAE